METLIAEMVKALPSLVVLVWIILRQDARIDKLLLEQAKLIDTLMSLHPPQDDDPDTPAKKQ